MTFLQVIFTLAILVTPIVSSTNKSTACVTPNGSNLDAMDSSPNIITIDPSSGKISVVGDGSNSGSTSESNPSDTETSSSRSRGSKAAKSKSRSSHHAIIFMNPPTSPTVPVLSNQQSRQQSASQMEDSEGYMSQPVAYEDFVTDISITPLPSPPRLRPYVPLPIPPLGPHHHASSSSYYSRKSHPHINHPRMGKSYHPSRYTYGQYDHHISYPTVKSFEHRGTYDHGGSSFEGSNPMDVLPPPPPLTPPHPHASHYQHNSHYPPQTTSYHYIYDRYTNQTDDSWKSSNEPSSCLVNICQHGNLKKTLQIAVKKGVESSVKEALKSQLDPFLDKVTRLMSQELPTNVAERFREEMESLAYQMLDGRKPGDRRGSPSSPSKEEDD